jgi:fimbrial chaperone protein
MLKEGGLVMRFTNASFEPANSRKQKRWMQMKHIQFITWIGLAALLIFIAASANAFSFAPIVVDFTPTGPEATRTMTAENKGTEKVAIQVSAYTRTINEEGKEELTATENFKIFPEQFVLAPGVSRAVRVTYRGPTQLKNETAYRIVAEQLPVDMQKKAKTSDGGRLNFLIRYETSVYVRPSDTKPFVKVERISKTPETGTIKNLEVILQNDGTAHQLLGDIRLSITSKSGVITLNQDQLKVFEKQNLLAGARRKFVIPWDGKPLEGPLTASISFH